MEGLLVKVSASVYMTLKVEVYVGGWEAAQPFEQLHAQATREATQSVRRLLGNDVNNAHIRIVDEPAVMHVITREQKS